MKKFVFAIFLISIGLSSFADDINMTPQNSYSGYYNKSAIKTSYPTSKQLETSQKADFMKPKSVLEMGSTTSDTKTPMTYNQFPQNYDSSNMMLMQGIQNGLQNLGF
jgi:hypothetical protein